MSHARAGRLYVIFWLFQLLRCCLCLIGLMWFLLTYHRYSCRLFSVRFRLSTWVLSLVHDNFKGSDCSLNKMAISSSPKAVITLETPVLQSFHEWQLPGALVILRLLLVWRRIIKKPVYLPVFYPVVVVSSSVHHYFPRDPEVKFIRRKLGSSVLNLAKIFFLNLSGDWKRVIYYFPLNQMWVIMWHLNI